MVPHEVFVHIETALVECTSLVGLVALKFVSIYSPVDEGENGVLEGNPCLGTRVNVEGHVIITLDAHEVVIGAQDRPCEGLLAEVSPHCLPIHFYIIKQLYILPRLACLKQLNALRFQSLNYKVSSHLR